jgi:inosose dehydratase
VNMLGLNILGRVAAAPISWGVCEVPGWGHQMWADRVLAEMRTLGLRATELGPDGFLPATRAHDLLREHGLSVVAGFVPAVLHDASRHDRELHAIRADAQTIADLGGEVLVLAASSGRSGYESADPLDPGDWRVLADGVRRAAEIAEDLRLRLAVHPHRGTVIERLEEVDRLLDRTDVGLCLDTGHVAVGGGDPLDLARRAAARVVHVHLKDVDAALARRVVAGDLGYRNAVREGLYRPLGDGDLDVIAIVRALEESGYLGWYVLESDEVLDREPPPGAGPIEDVRRSLAFLGLAWEEVGAARES